MQAPEIFEHSSGLRVILQRKPEAQVVAAQVWVHVGSADEEADEAGLAHVHEHMMFKGTERRAVGEIARQIEGVGGNINAWTSFDGTVYHIIVPSRYAAEGLDILLDAMQHSAFDADELGRELEVIQEEIRRGEDTPSRVLMNSCFGTVFEQHPYGMPVIGTSESVDSFTREHIVRFYRKWYHPKNMTLVVSGDLTREELTVALDASMDVAESGSERPEARTRSERPTEPPQTEFRSVVVHREVEAAEVNLIFRGPALADEDVQALDILVTLLGSGSSSVLFERIRRKAQLVDSIYGFSYLPRDPGMVLFGMSFDPGETGARTLEVIKTVTSELAAAKETRFARADLARAIRLFEAETIHQQQTAEGQAQRLGHFDSVAGDVAFERAFIEKARAVTPADLLRVANKYFRLEHMTIGVLLPHQLQSRGVDHDALADAARRGFAAAAAGAEQDVEPDVHGVRRYQLPVGTEGKELTLLIEVDASVPVFAINVVTAGGQTAEPAPAVGAMMAKLLTLGTPTRSAAEIAKQLDYLGASMGGSSGMHTCGMSMTGLSRDLDGGLDVLEDALFSSNFPTDEVERVRREMKRAIERRKDNLSGSAIRVFNEHAYGGHVYARPAFGELEDVDAITRDDLIAYHAAVMQPQSMIISVVGDVEPAEILARVTRWAEREVSGPSVVNELAPPAASNTEALRTEQTRDREQSHVVLGFPGVSAKDPRFEALNVLSTILAGQGGRLFLDLRDKRSLAYSVTAFSRAYMLGGIFVTYIGTSPGKVDEAIEGMREHLERVRNELVGAEELDRAKRYMIGSRDVGRQQRGVRASAMSTMEVLGFGYERAFSFAERVSAVTAEELRTAARELFAPEREIISIVGPE